MDLKTYGDILGIKGGTLSFLGEGGNGVVLTDGSGIAYKFPKHESVLRRLKHETEIVKHVSGFLSVCVPDYDVVCLERPIGEAYCAYPLIPGVPLSKEIYAIYRREMSKQLLLLLDEIHSITPLEEKRGGKIDFEIMYHEIQNLLFPLIEDSVKRHIESRFEAYFRGADQIVLDDCVVHGDFGCSNILCDPQTGRITGIIDWAESTVDDPAIDYSSLTCAASIPQCKEDFLALRPSLYTMFQRSAFIQYTFPMQEALHGVKTNDEASLFDGLSAMKLQAEQD